MAAALKALEGDSSFPLDDFNLIGRSQDATIRLNDSGISRQHATIRREGRLFWITDLGSANGSYVNDTALSSARVLRSGDRIQLGTTVFQFCQDDNETTRELAGGQTQMLGAAKLPVNAFQATLLVADLRDFTKISAQLTAEEVAAMLREWYADCETILGARGAVIDKFLGDGVFAYWQATDPATRKKAAEAAALLCGSDLTKSPARKHLMDAKGIIVRCHAGLNIGEVAVGAMGRGSNTAVGEAVNVTFRVESLTRKLDKPVLATAAFVAGLPDAATLFEPAGTHVIKGQPDPVEVFILSGC